VARRYFSSRPVLAIDAKGWTWGRFIRARPAHLPKDCRRPEPIKVSAAPIGRG